MASQIEFDLSLTKAQIAETPVRAESMRTAKRECILTMHTNVLNSHVQQSLKNQTYQWLRMLVCPFPPEAPTT